MSVCTVQKHKFPPYKDNENHNGRRYVLVLNHGGLLGCGASAVYNEQIC